MKALRGLSIIAVLAGLGGCGPQVAQIEPQTYQISLPDWWPLDTQGGAAAGLDYAALGLCPNGYTKLEEHSALPNLTWKIRCDVPRGA